MKTATTALLTLALGAAALLAAPASAADGENGTGSGETARPAPAGECGAGAKKESGDAVKCTDGDAGCDKAGADCAKCAGGEKEGRECCAAKKAAADLQVVTLSILDAEGKGWEAVVAAVPEKEINRLEKERRDAWKGLVKVRRAIEAAKAECKAACEEAKAEGKEPSCEVTSAYDNDVKELEAKARGILDALAATVKELVGADEVPALAEAVRKDGDVAKSVMEKVRAEAAKPEEPERKDPPEEAPAPADKPCGS